MIEVLNLYDRAMRDQAFLDALLSADSDTPPEYPSDIEKALLSCTYYGYRVALHGDHWADFERC